VVSRLRADALAEVGPEAGTTLASLKQALNPESSDFRLGRCQPPTSYYLRILPHLYGLLKILQQNSLAQHWARDWRALALTQVHVHHGSRLSDSCEGGRRGT